MRAQQERIERALEQVLPQPTLAPAKLHEAMRYAVLGGGKRMRPLLAFAAGEVTQALPERASAGRVAVELIHAYSLVHDDLLAWTMMTCAEASRAAMWRSMRPRRCW